MLDIEQSGVTLVKTPTGRVAVRADWEHEDYRAFLNADATLEDYQTLLLMLEDLHLEVMDEDNVEHIYNKDGSRVLWLCLIDGRLPEVGVA